MGLRFDQLYQFVDANQLSPRFAIVYKPVDGTTFHAGYARYFTPPYQAQATQSNVALFANTTNQPDQFTADPVKPERSHYFDAGIDQTVLPGLTMGLDAYYKMARDMIDDGQFGAAVVLTQFNYARGYSEGGEFKLKYTNGNFNAYANFAYNITRAIDVESNQYLFDRRDACLSAKQLSLHRRHAAHDRLGRRFLSHLRYDLDRGYDLRQRPARRATI